MAGIVDPYIIVDQCLEWIGFGIPNQRATISTEAGFNSLNDLNDIEEKDIRVPESTLKKKHNSICYHRCREAVAARVMRVAKEGTLTNLADLFTKPLMQAVREGLLDRFTY